MKKNLLPITILASLGVAALAGCGGGSGGGGGGGSTVDVTGVTLNKSSLELYPERSEKLVATVAPADATDKTVTWKSSNANVCTVDAEGLVTAVDVGIAKVTVTTVDGGFKAECEVSVVKQLNSLSITNKAEFEGMHVEDHIAVSVTGDPTINPTDLANKGLLKITSSNTEVATTTKLMVYAVGVGTTTITASLFGKTDSFVLTVTEKPVIDVNYGTLDNPLSVSSFLTEVAKLELADKAYSPEHFYVKAEMKTAPAGTDSYKFDIKDDSKDIAVSSARLEEGKTAADYSIGDIVTVRAYARADKSKSNGFYLSYNQGGTSGQEAPQIVYWEKGEGGEEVPEPAVVDKSLAEFIALEDSKALAYNVTAEVKSFKGSSLVPDKYGNMVLTDGTNDLVIYGSSASATALAWNKVDAYVFVNPQDFLTNEKTSAIKVGDTVKMKLIRADYNDTVQGTGLVLDVTPGGGGGEEVPEPAVVDKSLAEFIALEDSKALAYNVTAEVKSFKGSSLVPDKYGNMVLTDGTNDLVIYGSSATATALVWNKVDAYAFSNPQDFLTNEITSAIKVGDTVKMKLIRADYQGAVQGTGIVLNVTPGEGGGGEEVPEPAVADKTLAEFIALADSKALAYNVSAEVKSFKNGSQTADKYGNMVLTDGTNDLVIYGASATATALAWNKVDAYSFSNPQDFLTNEITSAIKVGDTVKMKLIRADYQGAVQGTGIVLNVTPGEGGGGGEDVDAVQLVPGTNGSAYKVKAGDTTYEGVKVGTSSKVGDMTIKVPATATKVTLHAAAWNGKAAVLTVTAENATVDKASLTLVSDSGIAGTANPFVLAAAESTYVCVLNLSNVTGAVSIKLATTDTANGRFVVWNVVAE